METATACRQSHSVVLVLGHLHCCRAGRVLLHLYLYRQNNRLLVQVSTMVEGTYMDSSGVAVKAGGVLEARELLLASSRRCRGTYIDETDENRSIFGRVVTGFHHEKWQVREEPRARGEQRRLELGPT